MSNYPIQKEIFRKATDHFPKLVSFILLSFSLPLDGQLINDEWDYIIPFSQSEKYKGFINTNDIHSLILPSYNNDSLFEAHNPGKTRKTKGVAFASGFFIDTTINIIKNGDKFKLDEGTLWVYTIESVTATGLDVRIDEIIICEGSYLAAITEDYMHQDPEYYDYEYFKDGHHEVGEDLYFSIIGHKMTIEYFQPKGAKKKKSITINRINYNYAALVVDPMIIKEEYVSEQKKQMP